MPATIAKCLTTREAAGRLGVHMKTMQRLCLLYGQQFGALQFGPAWMIPEDRLCDVPVRPQGRPKTPPKK